MIKKLKEKWLKFREATYEKLSGNKIVYRKIRDYKHEDWDFNDGFSFPRIIIPFSEHQIKNARASAKESGGGAVFKCFVKDNGDVIVFRDNRSIGRLSDTEVTIETNRYGHIEIIDL